MAIDIVERKVIRGTDVLVYVDGEFVGAQRNVDVNFSADTLDTTSKDTRGFKTSEVGLIEGKISLEALSLAGQKGYGASLLEKKFLTQSNITIKVIEAGKRIISGNAAIMSLSTSGNYSEASTISMEVSFTDAPTFTYVPYIKSCTFSGTTATVKLTEKISAATGITLKDCILVDGSTVSAATIGTDTAADTITVTLAEAPTAGKNLCIIGNSIQNGEAIQTGDLFMALSAAA